jgi:predicted Rossmann-fold nucleotide-binding protein
MAIDGGRAVIAIFGANDPAAGELPAARVLGEAAARLGAVLLTGGDGSDRGTVKDAALVAADAVGTSDAPATWVGVRNREQAAPPVWRRPQAVVVTPGWGHRRNFVEACLCDAAVVIGANSPGAASEALFCLYLGRPVVVVRRPAGDATDGRSLRELARTRIPAPRRPRRGLHLGSGAP